MVYPYRVESQNSEVLSLCAGYAQVPRRQLFPNLMLNFQDQGTVRLSQKGKSHRFPAHPGEILKAEFMEPMGLSAYALAKALYFPCIYDVVRGVRAVSAETAIRLGKYFGLPAQFWMNLQNDYDLRVAASTGIGVRIKPRKAESVGRAAAAS